VAMSMTNGLKNGVIKMLKILVPKKMSKISTSNVMLEFRDKLINENVIYKFLDEFNSLRSN